MDTRAANDPHRTTAPPDDWRNLIRAATHEDDVVSLVRDHLARWTPGEIARLPEDCRPGRIRDFEDISQWAYALAATHCGRNLSPEDEPALDRMLEFVTQAAIRITELKAAPNDYAPTGVGRVPS